jgi:uncharacterized glyoxalase superfamily protein PhnB
MVLRTWSPPITPARRHKIAVIMTGNGAKGVDHVAPDMVAADQPVAADHPRACGPWSPRITSRVRDIVGAELPQESEVDTRCRDLSEADASVPGMTAFAVVELVVADMAASLAFYSRLGLAAPAGSEGESHVELILPGGLKLALDSEEMIKSIDPHWTRPTGGHRIALAFQCERPAEVDQVFAELTGAGYRGNLEPFDAFWGQRYAIVLDPDGNPVDLFAPIG